MKPRAINKKAEKVFFKLTENLTEENRARRIGGEIGESAIMPVCVELIDQWPLGPVYSIAHYYKQNGDLMTDPEMTFLIVNGKVYPCSFSQAGLNIYWDYLYPNEAGTMRLEPKGQKDGAIFAGQWMVNIKDQQSGYFSEGIK